MYVLPSIPIWKKQSSTLIQSRWQEEKLFCFQNGTIIKPCKKSWNIIQAPLLFKNRTGKSNTFIACTYSRIVHSNIEKKCNFKCLHTIYVLLWFITLIFTPTYLRTYLPGMLKLRRVSYTILNLSILLKFFKILIF